MTNVKQALIADLKAAGQRIIPALERMNQPSSWAAYAAVAGVLGFNQTQYSKFAIVASCVCGLIATVRNDNSGAPPAA